MKKGKGRNNGLLPNSLRIISSCLKTVSSNAGTVASTVRSAGASVAATISAASSEDHKDQVTWAGFDSLELSPSCFKPVLLLGYRNGFQVFDVEDASNFTELVSKRDGAVSFLQMQPYPATSGVGEGYKASHPLLLVVAGDESNTCGISQKGGQSVGLGKNGSVDSVPGSCVNSPTTVQFYSLRSHGYVHVLRFRSSVCMVRCSPRVVAVGLATQIYCFDALTLENKFSVLTYPVPQLTGQGSQGINVGYGPMALGPRWLAFASNSPLVSNNGRVSSQNLSPSQGVSPSTSPSGSNLMARYAMESSKHLAAGIINLGDFGYKTLSKYCQELLPDGSNSPVSPSSGWKVGRLAATEIDNAGMVIIKDFVSLAVISQFKAHTSPISALCFDPSGTLLVTASIYGNNINIFRIMPSCTLNGSNVENFNWSSSHVHLYKLHRGITTAMIQDICFSHYSQWIAIVSSKGTCHIFVLSPFGGDTGFHLLNSTGEEPFVYPVLSLPWWSTPSYANTQQSFPPPNPTVLSVVSRIKYSSFGWLSTVNNSAASPTGKVFVPSGAVAAVFHNSLPRSLQHRNSRADSLEYLLVYTPSGHVVQHELRPSIGVEPSKGCSRPQSTPSMSVQEDELRVRVEPIQWWDVCRRSDWPEREDCPLALGTNFEKQEITGMGQNKSASNIVNGLESLDINAGARENKACEKPNEMSHWYLSNAEVQLSALRLPIWHKSKICFFMMDCPRTDSSDAGEIEIEKLPVHEVEMRQKELLPVYDHFHSIKSSWNDRVVLGVKYPSTTFPGSHNAEEKMEETVICHSKPASLSSTESSDGGSSRRIDNFIDFDQINCERSYLATCHTPINPERKENGFYSTVPTNDSLSSLCDPPSMRSQEKCRSDIPTSGTNSTPVGKVSKEENVVSIPTEASLLCSDQLASSASVPAEGSSVLHHSVDLGRLFREEHCKCKTPESNQCHGLNEVATDEVDGTMSLCQKEKPEHGEDDEILGGIFPFSE